MGNWNHFNIIRKLIENHKGKSWNQGTTENSHVWHCIHNSESTNEKYRTFNMGSNITCTINFNYRKPVDRFQWQHDLRSWSATAHLLGLRVRISMGLEFLLWMLYFVQIETSATGQSLLQASPTDYVDVNGCDQLRRWFGRRGHIRKEEKIVVSLYT